MNLELFKLRELPFRLSPDPQFRYLSKAHARAKAYMESTVWFTDGFVVITGIFLGVADYLAGKLINFII